MTRLQECADATAKEMGLRREDVREIAQQIEKFRKQKMAEGAYASRLESEVRKFAKGKGEQMRLAAALRRKQAALSIALRDEWDRDLAAFQAEGGGFQESILAKLVGSYLGLGKARQSVSARRAGLEGDWLGGMSAEITGKLPHVAPLLQRPKAAKPLMDDVVREWRQPGSTGNKDAAALKDIFAKYAEASRLEANRAGANIGRLDGWGGPQAHDAAKLIAAGKEQWLRDILPALDLERSFGEGTDAASAREVLGGIYDTIATGRSDRIGAREQGQRVGPANLANSLEKHRVLHFKDADSWIAYADRYSRGNIATAMIDHLHAMARTVSLMQVMGPNPQAFLDAVLESQRRKIRNGTLADTAKVKALASLDASLDGAKGAIGKAFAEVSGDTFRPGNITAAKIGSGIRAVESMAKLGGAVISSVTDLATYAARMRYQGRGLMQGYADGLRALFDRAGAKDRHHIGMLLGVGHESFLGGIHARFAAEDGMPGKMSRAMNAFFKLSGLTWWTDNLTDTFAAMSSVDMAHKSAMAWSELDGAYRHVLGLHGIDEQRWAVIRKLAAKQGDYTFIHPELARQVEDADVHHLVADQLDALGKDLADRVQKRAQQDAVQRQWVEKRALRLQEKMQAAERRLRERITSMRERGDARAQILADRIDDISGRLSDIAEFHAGIDDSVRVARQIGRREEQIGRIVDRLGGRVKAIGEEIAARIDRRDAGAGERFRKAWSARQDDFASLLDEIRRGNADQASIADAIATFKGKLQEASDAYQAKSEAIIAEGDAAKAKIDERITGLGEELSSLAELYGEVRGGIAQARNAGRDEGRLRAEVAALERSMKKLERDIGRAGKDMAGEFSLTWLKRQSELKEFSDRIGRYIDARAEAGARDLAAQPERIARIYDKARRDLELDLRSYFVDEASFAVLKGDDRTRMFVTQGTQPGTELGEAIRFIMQFKSFPVAYIQKILNPAFRGAGPGQSRDYVGLAALIGMSTVLGYGAMTIKDTLKNRTLRDPKDPKTWLAALVQGGGAGIYGDFLFSKRDRMGGGVLGSLGGPTLGTADSLIGIWQDAFHGSADIGPKKAAQRAGADAFQLALANTPFINLWYTRAALDLAVLNWMQDHVSPGVLKRREQTMKRDFGQRYIIDPTPLAR